MSSYFYHLLRHLDHASVFLDIMNTHKRTALHHTNYTGSQCSPYTLVYRQIKCQSDHNRCQEEPESPDSKKLQMIQVSRFISNVFPNPTPGSRMIFSSLIPAFFARLTHSCVSESISMRNCYLSYLIVHETACSIIFGNYSSHFRIIF